ncbi:uncharacterized protein LOC62_03G004603 [Vanrija pseudolonga]|uniref:Uncharacterized protein n=1 Tax=Vanrija pseudolonga TaxID=143232 RepID=A0AAF1BKH6_9TREE|nr:hypothetical protein LOC62_03G004603 [Vanrija pseudolonga]
MVHHAHHHDADPALAAGGIPNVANEKAVEEALNTDRAVQDQSYVKQVLEAYVSNKKKQGDDGDEISKKLLWIEQRFPHFKKVVDQVTNENGLKSISAV